ncbi:MAG: T9SS type A sorting domain-containing protein [Bacteroidales bacterium]|nr:T9SS type A sorting domain-containing protein [Bacteroidales bacterium]
MKKLIVIVFVLLTQISRAQNPVEKTVYYIPVQNNINSSTIPLEYNTQTTRLEQVLEVPVVVAKDPIHADSVQISRMESSENYKLKATMNHDSATVVLEYKLDTDIPATISIHDMKGVKLESMNTSGQQNQLTVITRDWLPGVYLAGLYVNGKLIASTKFTVVK